MGKVRISPFLLSPDMYLIVFPCYLFPFESIREKTGK